MDSKVFKINSLDSIIRSKPKSSDVWQDDWQIFSTKVTDHLKTSGIYTYLDDDFMDDLQKDSVARINKMMNVLTLELTLEREKQIKLAVIQDRLFYNKLVAIGLMDFPIAEKLVNDGNIDSSLALHFSIRNEGHIKVIKFAPIALHRSFRKYLDDAGIEYTQIGQASGPEIKINQDDFNDYLQ